MTRDTLRFVHADRPPAADEIRVFESLTRPFLGAAFTFRIIGSSHYVSAPAYGFYELAACDPANPGDRTGTELPLDPNRPPRRLAFETDAFRCQTVVEHRPLSAFPHDRFRTDLGSFDLAHAFDGDPEAVTTIELDEDGYETYHTYPEYDLALYTRSAFTVVREPAARPPVGSSADPAPDAAGDH
ncbi:DUF2617 family protein [Halosolutus gelatinilyticus]|uniref:DUF2617 family protein n=1 Tax=Halosolutus gelatinilyticus TaxID=2931975 RepID=UPI001FF48513|nr:DUF2617 family protein [Halosolutus gelatinilyticus]